MPDRLATYRSKRDASKTTEPVPKVRARKARGNGDTFVVQEHHARALHWDFRLERDDVLVSWALPKGVPDDPARNHLAVHTEDHPLEYATYAGEIPQGEYGGGSVTIWDAGTYETEKWEDDEVKVVLHGQRVEGRYVLFHTDGKNWMIHRMKDESQPPATTGTKKATAKKTTAEQATAKKATAKKTTAKKTTAKKGTAKKTTAKKTTARPGPVVAPMLATAGELPPAKDDDAWAYEMKWDGVRAVVYAEGGPLRVMTRNERDVASHYPELAGLADAVDHAVVLDGEVVAADARGRPSFGKLQQRMHVQHPSQELLAAVPVTYLAFDVLRLDGHDTTGLPWEQRRELLDSLEIAGAHWATPPVFVGAGRDAVEASQAQDLEGVMAKRRTSTYTPGRRSRDWVKIKHVRTQEVVVGGWTEGEGRRHGGFGSLLVGVHDPATGDLRYAGHVGTGFSDQVLGDLMRRMRGSPRQTSPFTDEVPRAHARSAHWVTPRLVGEVAFSEWTGDGILRHPRWRGLRPDKSAGEVVPES